MSVVYSEKKYDDLTESERQERMLSAAKTMKKLTEDEKSDLIEASDNVLDGRETFRFRMRQVNLAKAYKKPKKPTGVA